MQLAELTIEQTPLPEVNTIPEVLRCGTCHKNTRHEFRAMDEGRWVDYAGRVARAESVLL